MKTTILTDITINDIFCYSVHDKRCLGYSNEGDEGRVYGMKGKLNIRPPYQRTYCYDEKEAKDKI